VKLAIDTHCLLWYLQDNPRLSPASRRFFDEKSETHRIVVPTIVVAELIYVLRKLALHKVIGRVMNFLAQEGRFEIHPLSFEIVQRLVSLTQFDIHNALIVATALHAGVPLMTADDQITKADLVTILRP